MKKYTFDEIIKLWTLYKTPVFKASGVSNMPRCFRPGDVVNNSSLEEIYRFDKNMDFPTFIKKYEIDETEDKLEKLKE